MILKSLKTHFNKELSGYYSESENESFFNMLAEFILKMKRIDIALNLYQVVSGKKCDKFQTAIKRLQNYEPIQYIIGDTEFYGLKFKVDNSVLIPRPETEELVDWIIKENQSKASISILDIGTGSGCIAISLAKHLPNANVYALDISEDALKIASTNAKTNGVEVEFMEADVLENSFSLEQLKFDIIVSNPPYVRELEKEMMKENVLKYEPPLALFVENEDALLFYRKISRLSRASLKDNGQLYFEINEYLGQDTKQLMIQDEFEQLELKQDIFNKDRMIKGVLS